MGKKNHSRSTTPVPQKSTPETATVKANPTPSAYYDAFKYINGYAMFLVYPAFYTAATFLVAFIYQRKWTFEFVLPFFKSFVDSKDEISFEKLPFLILGILFFNTYWLSGWFSLTSQAFHSIGLDNNNPRENRAKLTGLAARLLATHQNCVESSSLILAAVVIPCLAKLDLSVHLNFLLMVLVARILFSVFYALNISPLRSLCYGVSNNACLLLLFFSVHPKFLEFFENYVVKVVVFYVDELPLLVERLRK